MDDGMPSSGFPLSPLQARSWRWNAARNCFSRCAVRVTGAAAQARLRARDALSRLTDAHEILRTGFVRPTGLRVPLQAVHDGIAPAWVDEDWRGCSAWATRLEALLQRQAVCGEEGTDARVRVTWVQLDDDEAVLVLGASALCLDGHGVVGLARMLLTDIEVAEPLQYIDVARWLEGLLEPGEGEEGRAHWSRQRALQWEQGHMPAARAAQAQGWGEVRLDVALSSAESAVLSGGPGGARSWLLACWQVLLQRRLRTQDLVVATAFDGRNDAQLADMLGPLTRYLPVRTPAAAAEDLYGHAAALAQMLQEAEEWQEYFTWPSPDADTVWAPRLGFSLLVVAGGAEVRWLAHSACEDRFELKLGVLMDRNGLHCTLGFDSARHRAADMDGLLAQWRTLVRATLAQPRQPVSTLSHVDAHTQAWLQRGHTTDGTVAQTVHALFSAGAQSRPEAIALHAVAGERWQAVRLEQASNRLAHHLREAGVSAEDRVAVCLGRGPAWIVSLLAVLKAGAVYVPIDPEFHPHRIAQILADAGCMLALSDTQHVAALGSYGGPALLLDQPDVEAAVAACPATAVADTTDVDQLAYLIYTSGSTGVPKGVAISHRAVHAYVRGVAPRLDLTEDAELLSLATIGADLGHTALLVALCTGRTLRLLPSALALDAEGLAAELERAPVDCLKIVPTHLQALLSVERPERVLPRQCLVLGGSALEPERVAQIRALRPDCRIINHYGPTETTVGICTHAVQPEEAPGVLPIGQALVNSQAYVLDAQGRLAGVGMPGELYLGGESLARGYWGRPELTAERFVPDPFGAPGSRLYRTGDLCLQRADGAVVYQGRLDQQVKIRGYRVELGEVESVLCGHPALADAVVVLDGERLCAYVVAGSGTVPDADALRAWLSVQLPDYMVPTAWQVLKALPLNRNGKVDRSALPAVVTEATRGRAYRAPSTPLETQLVDVWQQVLGVPQVGVDDDFFVLGGDSIMAIQLAARVNRHGYALQPKRLFEARTIAAVAADLAVRVAPMATVDAHGPLALLPSQARFFAMHPDGLHQFNQAMYLDSKERVHWPALRAAVQAVHVRHDALNAVFTKAIDGRWTQSIRASAHPPSPCVVDLSNLPQMRRASVHQDVAAQVQASLHIEQGPLSRLLVICEEGADAPCRLLWVFHHLLVDGVSWRILLEDISAAYHLAASGQPVALPGKGTPLRAWGDALVQHAVDAVGEVAWWEAAIGSTHGHACDPRPEETSTTTLTVQLDAVHTEVLLRRVPAAYDTGINDVLLTALAMAFARWDGTRRLLIELEGHGREEIGQALDTSATVGWLTSRHPVRLPDGAEQSAGRLLATVKDALRAVPCRGLGYGALRYCSTDSAVRERMAALEQPQVSFNYMGQVARTALGPTSAFDFEPTAAGGLHEAGVMRAQPLAIGAAVNNGVLDLHFVVSPAYPQSVSVDALAVKVLDALVELAGVADEQDAPGCTPSDFPGSGLGLDALRTLVSRHGGRDRIEAIHPVTAVQHALLFETLLRPGAGINMMQMELVIEGDLDPVLLRGAWEHVVARHPVLRTVFGGLDASHPYQLILSGPVLDWRMSDWTGIQAPEDLLHDQRAQDRAAPLDLAGSPAMNVRLIRMGSRLHRLVWTRHHALTDGWSSAIVLREVLEHYAMQRAGHTPEQLTARPFSDYVAWNNARPLETADAYWRAYLDGITRSTRIGLPADWHRSTEDASVRRHAVFLTPALLSSLRDVAQREQVTLGSLYHAAWGLLLAEQDGHPVSVFGAVLSGRPADLDGADGIVGPLIRTLPLKVACTAQSTLGAVLRDVQRDLLEHDLHGHLPLSGIQALSALPPREPLLSTILVVQNYVTSTQRGEMTDARRRLDIAVSHVPATPTLSSPLLVTLSEDESGRVCVDFTFDEHRLSPGAITTLAQRFLEVLDGVSNGRLPPLVVTAAVDDGGSTPHADVEACLLGFPGVSEVIVLEPRQGGGGTVAYIVLGRALSLEADRTSQFVARLRAHLAATLPVLQLPSAVVVLDALPRAVDGSIARDALPYVPDDDAAVPSYQAPEGEIEQQLAACWMDLLSVPKVGRMDDFFALGGHSLLAIRLAGFCERQFGVQLPLVAFFNASSLAALADTVRLLVDIQHPLPDSPVTADLALEEGEL
ncbi:amino acid adenylation domain-containing protein [Stenotrophomonas maltophilia]|nr:amino acid adenylation domain-containing protein [Stenotrophomonas maltophilia]